MARVDSLVIFISPAFRETDFIRLRPLVSVGRPILKTLPTLMPRHPSMDRLSAAAALPVQFFPPRLHGRRVVNDSFYEA